MTLLAPTAALMAAGLTLPVLLVFYLLKLRRRPMRVSATYLWTQTLRELQVNVPLRWLRSSWLLVLHLLILGLLILAIGRPAMPVPGLAAQRVVILIDRSASMSAVDVETGQSSAPSRSRLEQAKIEARRIIDDLFASGSGRSAAIVTFAAEARDLTGFTSDRGRLRIALDELTPTDQPGDLAAGLRLVDALISTGSTDEDAEARDLPTLVVLSDGSLAGDTMLPAVAANIRYLPMGPVDDAETGATGTSGRTYSANGYNNVGVVSLAARRDYDNPGIVRIFARVQNASAYPKSTVLTLSLDAKPVARKPIAIPGAQQSIAGTTETSLESATPPSPASSNPNDARRTVAGPLDPGQTTITFETQAVDAALVAVSLADADALAADDAAAMVVPAATRPRVLLVVPDADIDSGSELEDNLAEMRLASLRKFSASDYEAMAARTDITGIDLVIFDRVTPRRVPPVATLSFGAALPLAGLSLAPSPENAGTYFLSWLRTHPIMRAVAPDTVIVGNPMSLTYERPDAGGPLLTELARGNTGPLIVLLETGRQRRIITAFDPAESTWPLQPGFTVFLVSSIDYLTLRGEESAGRFFTTAAAARAHLPSGPIPPRLSLTGPTSFSIAVPPGASRDDDVSLGLIERAGVYRIENSPPGPDGLICVNLLDEDESALRVNPSLAVAGRPVRPYAAEQAPREIWPWFIAAAGVLLAIEWFLYAWRMRV